MRSSGPGGEDTRHSTALFSFIGATLLGRLRVSLPSTLELLSSR